MRAPDAPARVAAIVARSPREIYDIMQWLHRHCGAGFVQRVLAHIPSSTTPGPRPIPKDATEIDGHLLGADHQAYPPGTPTSDVPAFTPQHGASVGSALYVNGILGDPNRQAGIPAGREQTSEAQEVSNAFHLNVVAVHNASVRFVADSAEALSDKLGISSERAISTLASSMIQEVNAGRSMTYIGHSQGALQVCRAIEIAIAVLQHQHPAATETGLREMVRRSIHIVTLAGAAANWPDGPRYDHFANTADDVPNLLGVFGWFADGGAHARYHEFTVTSTRRDEGELPAGVSNVFAPLTDAINRETHGLGLYTDAVAGKPIEQATGAHPVAIRSRP